MLVPQLCTAGLQVLPHERLGLLKAALFLQQHRQVAQGSQSVGMPVAQLTAPKPQALAAVGFGFFVTAAAPKPSSQVGPATEARASLALLLQVTQALLQQLDQCI